MSTTVLKSFYSKSLGLLRLQYKNNVYNKFCACTLTSKSGLPGDDGYQTNKSMIRQVQYRYKSTLPPNGEDCIRVYYGVLTPQIQAVKFFSLTTSMAGLVAQPVLFYQGSSLVGIPVLVAVGTFVGFFTFVTPFLLHIITKKYVTELHYNPSSGQYIATVYNFFLRRKKITFQPSDVVVPEIPGMFTSFLVKGFPLFVDARLFEEPQHFAKIMGYDKPIDFKLENASDGTKQEKT